MSQSPSRIEELVKIFIHATKVSGRSESGLIGILILSSWKLDFGTWDPRSELDQ
jgi:hypothetical protein